MRLIESLANLELALAEVGHPLAISDNRPPGRSAGELQEQAVRLLGAELPAELVVLWGWTAGLEGKIARSHPSSLGYTERLLPGGVLLYDLEHSVKWFETQLEVLVSNELDQEDNHSWLKFAAIDKGTPVFAELNNAGLDGVTPVSICDFDDLTFDEPMRRFDSIAAMVDVQAGLLRDGRWVGDDGLWQYDDDWQAVEDYETNPLGGHFLY